MRISTLPIVAGPNRGISHAIKNLREQFCRIQKLMAPIREMPDFVRSVSVSRFLSSILPVRKMDVYYPFEIGRRDANYPALAKTVSCDVMLLIPLSFSRALALASQPARRRNWTYAIVTVLIFVAGCSQLQFNYPNPLVDHGPDFRRVYAYLIGRVSPRDKVGLGGSYNQKALIYYRPNPCQIETHYQTRPKERANPPPNIWIVTTSLIKEWNTKCTSAS
jgi:hypothetical protein